LEARQPVWVVAEPRLAFAPFPERPAWLPAPEPNRQLSVDRREVLAHSPPADLAGQVLRWGLAHLEWAPSRVGIQEVSPSRPEPAMRWSSATLVPEATHSAIRLWAMAYSAKLSDQVACRAFRAWPRD